MTFFEPVLKFCQFLISSNFVNFLLMIGLLWYLCKKFNMGSILADGIKKVVSEISDSENKKNEALLKLESSNKKYDNLPLEIDNINNEAKLRTETLLNDIELSVDNSVKILETNYSKLLNSEEKGMSAELTSNALKSAVNSAESIIVDRLKNDESLQYKLIDECLDNLERVGI